MLAGHDPAFAVERVAVGEVRRRAEYASSPWRWTTRASGCSGCRSRPAPAGRRSTPGLRSRSRRCKAARASNPHAGSTATWRRKPRCPRSPFALLPTRRTALRPQHQPRQKRSTELLNCMQELFFVFKLPVWAGWPTAAPAAPGPFPGPAMQTPTQPTIVLLGALDTKGPELGFVAEALSRRGWPVRLLHIGIREPAALPASLAGADIRHVDVAPGELAALGKVPAMARIAATAGPQLVDWLARGEIAGVLALGGGVGTWVGAEAMRALPFGFPKLVVSTLPYDIRPLLHGRDIVFFSSVADILGLNPELRAVLANAVAAIDGMARTWTPLSGEAIAHTLGATGLGITTPALLAARDCNRGGRVRARELPRQRPRRRRVRGVDRPADVPRRARPHDQRAHQRDLRRHRDRRPREAHHRRPSRRPAGRLPRRTRHREPRTAGGLDPTDRARPHYAHSPTFTHVRIDAAGMRKVAAVLAARLNAAIGPTAFALPLQGLLGREPSRRRDPRPGRRRGFPQRAARAARPRRARWSRSTRTSTTRFLSGAPAICCSSSSARRFPIPTERRSLPWASPFMRSTPAGSAASRTA